jgi:two-component system cell cycle sensor histidine kinase/response regulator CckA
MLQFQFLDFIGVHAFAIDENYNILGINCQAKKMFQEISRKNIKTGDNLTDLFIISHLSEIYKKFETIFSNFLESKDFSLNHPLHISEDLTFQLSLQKNQVENLTFYVITGTVVNGILEITNKTQIRYEEQLEVFRNLFDLAPIGLAIKDLEGGFFKVNQGLCHITGFTKEELVNIQSNVLFPDFKKEKEKAIIDKLALTNIDDYKSEKKIAKSNGEVIEVSENLHLIRDEMNQPYLLIVSYQDLTEEKALQQQLIEARKMEELGRLSGGIAHDFNNMLLPVTLISDIALKELEMAPKPLSQLDIKLITYLQKISTSALRAKVLIQKLFQYSQTGIYDLKPIQLVDEIKRIYSRLKNETPNNIELILEMNDLMLPILGEASGIEQIIENLVVNSFHSIKYKTDGTVVLRVYEYHNEIIVEVEDNGNGIQEGELENIFTPFYSGRDTTQGTGMGLIVVQTIVHKMNGKLRLYSNPGKGTIFQLSFPKWKKY